ncbi:MAG: helix-turn-helix domain-containing protein [Candidatus Sulfotelmatobacter sp.]
MEPFVDANTVAEHLKISRRQALEMTRRGILPGYPLGVGSSRRVWRYKLSEIDAAVASGTKNPPESAICQTALPRAQSELAVPGSQRRQL